MKKTGRQSVSLGLFCLSALVISDDVLFVFPVGSDHIRVVQLLLALAILTTLWRIFCLPLDRVVIPLGYAPLILWFFTLAAFVFNVPAWGLSHNIGYVGWLLLSILLVFAMCNAADTEAGYMRLLRWYFAGTGIVAGFGIYQSLAPALRLPTFLVQQWLFEDVWPRASGLSYEPSYLATYLIPGWVALDYLKLNGSGLFSRKSSRLLYIVITAALILSTSRMGWLAMMVWLVCRTLLHLATPGIRTVAFRSLVAAAAILIPALLISVAGSSLLVGRLTSGIIATESANAYSVEERLQTFLDTLKVFEQNPLLGVSLGGIGPNIALNNHVDYLTGAMSFRGFSKVESFCITAEALAAGGIVGSIFYLTYFTVLFRYPFRLDPTRKCGLITKALCWGLIFEFGLLHFNQNILRTYFWFHIGLLCCGYALASSSRKASISHLPVPVQSTPTVAL